MADYQIDPDVLEAIAAERQRQIDKWGRYKDMPPPTWLMVLGEEYGEACAAAHDALYEGGDEADLTAELVQVAAVAIAWLEERCEGMSLCLPEYRHDYRGGVGDADLSVEVVEYDDPRPEDPDPTYTILCSRCGEQGNYLQFSHAQVAAVSHRREHLEVGNDG